MALRCFLFCSDEGTSDIIRQVLTGLDVEGETCATPTTAVEKVASEAFHLVVIDWDQQPEAAMVLNAAHDRKASERPLTLAIVSDDISVPKALQAGANSILRKPLVVNQVTDTLTTARDLLRSRLEPKPQAAAAAASAGSPSTLPASMDPGKEKMLRAGEFLQSAPPKPGGQFVTESESSGSPGESFAEPVDALMDLEPVAAPAPPPPPLPDEPRTLEWYLKRKGVQSAAAAPVPARVPNGKPELLGYDQTLSSSAPQSESRSDATASNRPAASPSAHEQKKEAELFAYIAGDSAEPTEASPSKFGRAKGTIIGAMVLAAIAIAAAPQAPWHPQMKAIWAHGQRSLHAWLNPQAVTAVAVAPTSHEDFGRAGDEYKMPVPENIPDATTDPSQIQVLPAVDPTAKKPAADANNPDQTQTPTDVAPPTPTPATDASQPAVQTPAIQPVQTSPAVTSPTTTPAVTTPASTGTLIAPPSNTQPHPDLQTVATTPVSSAPPPPRRQPAPYVPATTKVPSSLQSQMVVMTPDASGNKSPESAMPAIEPVEVPEPTERGLLTDQPAMSYPASAKGQQGTVILQVLIGRDGAVQDAKFLQGSLAFARTAIDGVRQWKFKPYTMNGRPVSVQTVMTIKFKPGQ